MRNRLASNAAANVANGIAMATFQLGMAAVVARLGSVNDFSRWSVTASLAGFAPLLSFNLSLALTRVMSAPTASVDALSVIKASRWIARRLTWMAAGCAALAGAFAQFAYPELARGSAAFWVMVSMFFFGSSWVIAAQTDHGWLTTHHRNWPITAGAACCRALALAAMVIVMAGMQAPTWVAVGVAAAALWSGVFITRVLAQAPRHRRIANPPIDPTWRHDVRSLVTVMHGFAVWNLTSAAIQAAAVPLVSLMSTQATTPFFIAFTLVTTVMGGLAAAFAALMAPMADLIRRNAPRRLRRLAALAQWSIWGITQTLLLAVGLALPWITELWLGAKPSSMSDVISFYGLLAMQHGCRCVGASASIVLALAAPSRVLRLAPLFEAGAMLFIALPLGAWGGPVAFASGLVAAAAIGVLPVVWIGCSLPVMSVKKRFPWIGLTIAMLCVSIALWIIVFPWLLDALPHHA